MDLLLNHNITNCTLMGDSRFDRVNALLDQNNDIENIKEVASLIKILSQEKDKRKLIEEDEVVEKIISENFFI